MQLEENKNITIGIAGPMTLNLIEFNWEKYNNIPYGYPYPSISYLINELKNKKFKIVLFTTDDFIKDTQVFADGDLTICVIKRNKHQARTFFSQVINELIIYMKIYKVDIMIAQWANEFAVAALIVYPKTIVLLHDVPSVILKYIFLDCASIETLFYWTIRYLLNLFVKFKAKFFIANSEYVFNKLSRINQRKTIIMNNSINLELIQKFNNIKKDKIIISVNIGFGYLKNVKNALKAFSIFVKKHSDYHYVLIGNEMGLNEKAYIYAKQYNLTKNVIFMGKQPHEKVLENIIKAEVFLHTSREESFGMVLLESQVLGTVVIGGEKSGFVPYLLEQGKAGVLCNVNNPTDIANKLEFIIKNQELKKEIERFAKENAIKKYNMKIEINKLIAIFNKVI